MPAFQPPAAETVGPDEKTKAPTPAPEKPADEQTEFKVADVHDEGVFLEMDDGRHFAAALADGADKPRRGSKVKITKDSLDKDGVPVGAKVSS